MNKMHEAEDFFIKNWNDEKMKIHSKCVINCGLTMIDQKIAPDIIIIAGWLHDMGKIIDKKNHHIESVKYVNKFIKQNKKYERLYEDIVDCVLNHRSCGNPKTRVGKIFQKCDKLALNEPEWEKFM